MKSLREKNNEDVVKAKEMSAHRKELERKEADGAALWQKNAEELSKSAAEHVSALNSIKKELEGNAKRYTWELGALRKKNGEEVAKNATLAKELEKNATAYTEATKRYGSEVGCLKNKLKEEASKNAANAAMSNKTKAQYENDMAAMKKELEKNAEVYLKEVAGPMQEEVAKKVAEEAEKAAAEKAVEKAALGAKRAA